MGEQGFAFNCCPFLSTTLGHVTGNGLDAFVAPYQMPAPFASAGTAVNPLRKSIGSFGFHGFGFH